MKHVGKRDNPQDIVNQEQLGPPVTKESLGLENVNNTADLDKPLSRLAFNELARRPLANGVGAGGTWPINILGGGPWDAVQDKPATFPPSPHTHTIANVTGLQTALNGKQATLVSGTDIKTVGGQSLLGSGDIALPAGGGGGGPETTFTLTGTAPVITPSSGDIQTWALTANSTPTLGAWASGEGLSLQITYGTFTVAWPPITWWTDDNLAPDPSKSAGKKLVVLLWKVGSEVHGK